MQVSEHLRQRCDSVVCREDHHDVRQSDGAVEKAEQPRQGAVQADRDVHDLVAVGPVRMSDPVVGREADAEKIRNRIASEAFFATARMANSARISSLKGETSMR